MSFCMSSMGCLVLDWTVMVAWRRIFLNRCSTLHNHAGSLCRHVRGVSEKREKSLYRYILRFYNRTIVSPVPFNYVNVFHCKFHSPSYDLKNKLRFVQVTGTCYQERKTNKFYLGLHKTQLNHLLPNVYFCWCCVIFSVEAFSFWSNVDINSNRK